MNCLLPVEPTKPAAPYHGGKRLLANTLIERINAIPHKSYVEPFCGMGGVFFRRDHKPSCEVLNDLNGEVINFFRILQRHRAAFEEMLRYSVPSRSEFDRLVASDVSDMTDLERAYRFIYLQKSAFGGQVILKGFGVQPGACTVFPNDIFGKNRFAVLVRCNSFALFLTWVKSLAFVHSCQCGSCK